MIAGWRQCWKQMPMGMGKYLTAVRPLRRPRPRPTVRSDRREVKNRTNRKRENKIIHFGLQIEVLARIDRGNEFVMKCCVFWTGQTLISIFLDPFRDKIYFSGTFQENIRIKKCITIMPQALRNLISSISDLYKPF